MTSQAQLIQLLAAVKDCNWRACEDWGTANMLYESPDSHLTIAEALTGTDALTGLLNLAGYKARAKSMLQQAHREGLPLFVTVLDLDGLKQVNDGAGGHHAGDMLIMSFANLLEQTVRHSDAVGRTGGDEFTVLQTADGGQLLKRAVAAHASCGTAKVEPSLDKWDAEHAMRMLSYATSAADEAMYKNKRARKQGEH